MTCMPARPLSGVRAAAATPGSQRLPVTRARVPVAAGDLELLRDIAHAIGHHPTGQEP